MPKDAFDDTEEEKKPKPEDEEEGKEVPTEPDENDDEPAGETGESAESRAEKKKNRYRENREAREAAEKRAADMDRQLQEERTARIAAQTAAQFYATQQQSQQQPQQDPWAEAENHVKEKFKFILGETTRLRAENRLDETATSRLQNEWLETQRAQQELVVRKQLWAQSYEQQRMAPQYEQQQRVAAVEARLSAEYPEVMNHQAAKAHAIGGWQQAMASGKANSWETAKEVMASTMRAFRLGRPPPVDDVTRRRYSGIGGGSNGAGPGRATFRMTKAHEKMAEGRYPRLTPELAHKKWAQTVGKKILEED
jgi:hypothetical protein